MQKCFFFFRVKKCKNALIKKETNKNVVSLAVSNFQYTFALLIMVVHLRIGEIIHYFGCIIMS